VKQVCQACSGSIYKAVSGPGPTFSASWVRVLSLTPSSTPGFPPQPQNIPSVITLEAKDKAGNTATASVTITVRDQTAPTVKVWPSVGSDDDYYEKRDEYENKNKGKKYDDEGDDDDNKDKSKGKGKKDDDEGDDKDKGKGNNKMLDIVATTSNSGGTSVKWNKNKVGGSVWFFACCTLGNRG
jgi:hypothetical protein